jgi:hypothetical protein
MKSTIEKKQAYGYKDVENMGPIEKFEKFGRFPTKMIVHLLLVIFTTCQAVLIVAEHNKYSRSQERFLYNMFIDSDDKRQVDYNRVAYLYSVEDVKNHVRGSVNNFYGLKAKSLEIVQFTDADPFLRMEFGYIDNDRVKKMIKSREEGAPVPGLKLLEGSQKSLSELDSNILPPQHTNIGEPNSNTNPNSLFIRNNVIPKKFDYKITNTSLGPFDYPEDDVKEFLNDVVEFRLNYTLKTYVPYYYSNNYDCNFWSVTQFYNFAQRAHFNVRLSVNRLACPDYTDGHSYADLFVNKLLWVHVIVLFLAIVSLILTWNYISWVAGVYMKVKFKHKQKMMGEDENAFYTRSEDSIYYNPLLDENLRKRNEEEMEQAKNALNSESVETYSQFGIKSTTLQIQHAKTVEVKTQYKFDSKKLKLHEKEQDSVAPHVFNKWSIITLIGNVIQIFASAVSIFDTNNILSSSEILIGFGCMFAFLSIGKYIEYSENYSTIYRTIKNSLPNVGRYLLGVAPIFLGFIFFGLCIFWKSERFTSTSSSMIILFSLAQGDSVFDAFKDLSGFYFIIGQIYLYLFCIIFIVVVLNIFIAIIEEAYINSKMQSKTHWVFDYIKKDKRQHIQFKPPIEEMKKKEEEIVSPKKGMVKAYSSRNLPPMGIMSKSKKSESKLKNKKFPNLTQQPQRGEFSESFQSLGSRPFVSETEDMQTITANTDTIQTIYKKKISEEFSIIEEDLKAILQLSMEVKLYNKEDAFIDELRINVLDKLNGTVLTKTEELRSIVEDMS